jgi:hypothetical protein
MIGWLGWLVPLFFGGRLMRDAPSLVKAEPDPIVKKTQACTASLA